MSGNETRIRLRIAIIGVAAIAILNVWMETPIQAQFVKKLTALDGAANDYFGGFTETGGSGEAAIFGDTVIVGAVGNNNGTGAAYIFDRNEGGVNNWGQVKKLIAPDAAESEFFGSSVALYEDLAIVGASNDGDSNPDDDVFDGIGAAYIFARNQGGTNNWGSVAKLTPSDGTQFDAFGNGADVYGDTVVLANTIHDNTRGAAYVFNRNEGGTDNWGEVAKLTASNAAPSNFFSAGLSIFGETTVMGAPLNDDRGTWSGSGYIFERDEGGPDNWGESTTITASDARSGEWFGIATDLSGDTAIIGASQFGPGSRTSGTAYIFERNAGGADNWGEITALAPDDLQAGEGFGESVAIDSDLAIVGARSDRGHTGVARRPGSAYVFSRNADGPNGWGEILRLMAPDFDQQDHFGKAVGIYGDTVVVAAPGQDFNTGAAYIFRVPEPTSAVLLGLATVILLLGPRRAIHTVRP